MKINSRIPSLQEWKKEHVIIRNNCIPGIKPEENQLSQVEKRNAIATNQNGFMHHLAEKMYKHVDSFFCGVQMEDARIANLYQVESKETETSVINLIKNLLIKVSKFHNEMFVKVKPEVLFVPFELKVNEHASKAGTTDLSNQGPITKSKTIVYYFFDFDLYKIMKIKLIKGLSVAMNEVQEVVRRMTLFMINISNKTNELIYKKMEKIAEKVSGSNAVQFRADML